MLKRNSILQSCPQNSKQICLRITEMPSADLRVYFSYYRGFFR